MFRPLTSRWLLAFLSFILCLSIPHSLHAQTETWQPATSGFSTEIKVWARSNGTVFAKVRLTFPSGGWRGGGGSVTRAGNNFTVESQVERWTGASTQAITSSETDWNLGVLQPGRYTFTFKSFGVVIKSLEFDTALIAERWEPTTVSANRVGLRIWNSDNGRMMAKVELYFPDTGYGVADWGQITRGSDEFSVDIKPERWTGESEARTRIESFDYLLGALPVGSYTFIIKMYGTVIKTQTFTINSAPPALKLLTEENSERAAALDSVTWLKLFPLTTTHNFSPDNHARIVLFLSNVQWSQDGTLPAVTAQAEDAEGVVHSLTVEYVGKVPGFDWLTQLIVRPPMGLKDGGDVWFKASVGGVLSNKALISIKPSNAN